jgi:hypothetical protein
MNCPYCQKEMREGGIPAQRDRVLWRSAASELGAVDQVPLSNMPWLTGQQAPAFYCPDCQVVLVPVPKLESAGERLKRRLDAAKDKTAAARTRWESQRAEKTAEKKTKRSKEKDPWEW